MPRFFNNETNFLSATAIIIANAAKRMLKSPVAAFVNTEAKVSYFSHSEQEKNKEYP
jgi:hypothetical protein